MGTVRDILERLEEATYTRDRAFRVEAEQFFDALSAFFGSKARTGKGGDPVKHRKGGPVWVKSTDVLPKTVPFNVVLEEFSIGGAKGAAGEIDGELVLILYLLPPGGSYPRDVKKIALILEEFRETVIHEMVHLLDRQRIGKAPGVVSASTAGKEAYYNSPGEWNAFWQAGASELERHLRAVMRGEEKPLVLRTVSDIQRQAHRFWQEGFLRHMDAKTRRKFDKRLADLWVNLREQGLLGAS